MRHLEMKPDEKYDPLDPVVIQSEALHAAARSLRAEL
jgi:hypothetical protein